MHTIRNLTIIGTSHIAIQSVSEVENAIESISPDIIALELDLARFKRLSSNKKEKISLRNIGQQGSLISFIGSWVEKYLGKKVGTMPGAEMKKAIFLAKKNRIKIALIDQDIQITLKKLKTRFSLKEKLKLIMDILKAPFGPRIKIDLTKVPEQKLINKLTQQVKKNYPSIYKTLIEERNEIMAQRLMQLMKKNNKIIAIIGAGHIEGIIKIIKWNLAKKK